CLHKAARTNVAQKRTSCVADIVHFREGHSSGVIHTTHDRRVVTRWQICYDRRFSCVLGRVPAGQDLSPLIASDNPAEDRSLPVIIGSNQRSRNIVQLQRGINHCIGNAMLSELRTYCSNNHLLCLGSLNNESPYHHVVTCLNKGPRTDVT